MDDDRRQALRRKIREKRLQRSGGSGNASDAAAVAKTLLSDPTSALLQLGIDDSSVLANASQIVSMAKGMATTTGGGKKAVLSKTSRESRVGRVEDQPTDDDEAPPPRLEEEGEDDEEAPPPPPP
tara:strand:+ start:751 stop:1125 length:375 start_codon:yes stop_codon:yes gene_type:complete